MVAEGSRGWDSTVINGDVRSLPLPQEPCSPSTTHTQIRREWDLKWVVVESGGGAEPSAQRFNTRTIYCLRILKICHFC